MTIKDAAKLYGISTQAVYQRLKKANINLDTLKDKETGEITPDGEAVFGKLFTKHEGQKPESFKSIIETQKQLIASLQKENGELVEKVSKLQKENDDLKADKENWYKALETAQRLHEETIQRLLPAGKGEQEGKGQKLTLRQRLTGRY